jgi:hypothetical protein
MVEAGARKSGFSRPTNVFQVLSWLLFIGFNASFYALLFLYTDTTGKAIWGTLFGICSILTGLSAVLATAMDPADPLIYSTTRADPAAKVDGHLYCYRCTQHVSQESKHCIVCRKCVHRFDHHCVWLNSCVGSRTYVYFFALLASAAAMLAMEIALCIYLVVRFGQSTDDFDARVRSFYPDLSGGAFFGITVGVLVVVFLVWLMVMQLFTFHIYLGASRRAWPCRCGCHPLAGLLATARLHPGCVAVCLRNSTLASSPCPLSVTLCLVAPAVWNKTTTYDYIVGRRIAQETRARLSTSFGPADLHGEGYAAPANAPSPMTSHKRLGNRRLPVGDGAPRSTEASAAPAAAAAGAPVHDGEGTAAPLPASAPRGALEAAVGACESDIGGVGTAAQDAPAVVSEIELAAVRSDADGEAPTDAAAHVGIDMGAAPEAPALNGHAAVAPQPVRPLQQPYLPHPGLAYGAMGARGLLRPGGLSSASSFAREDSAGPGPSDSYSVASDGLPEAQMSLRLRGMLVAHGPSQSLDIDHIHRASPAGTPHVGPGHAALYSPAEGGAAPDLPVLPFAAAPSSPASSAHLHGAGSAAASSADAEGAEGEDEGAGASRGSVTSVSGPRRALQAGRAAAYHVGGPSLGLASVAGRRAAAGLGAAAPYQLAGVSEAEPEEEEGLYGGGTGRSSVRSHATRSPLAAVSARSAGGAAAGAPSPPAATTGDRGSSRLDSRNAREIALPELPVDEEEEERGEAATGRPLHAPSGLDSAGTDAFRAAAAEPTAALGLQELGTAAAVPKPASPVTAAAAGVAVVDAALPAKPNP